MPPPAPSIEPPKNNHPMVTRAKAGIIKAKALLTKVTKVEADTIVPKNASAALKIPYWYEAMQDEYKALMRTITWPLLNIPNSVKVIGCKWLFSVKRLPNGQIQKYKAHLVAQGFHQSEGFNFEQVFSPVI
ncbi:uncharacterized mitochondrial protein AtMg00820-like [Arachis hypogaea]|uniref:uncharacterized mitochondrial protein AtMg00820-like n=1 Tax=Arachis hypogaea TaxID=3818 RepID=UPI000DECAC90|nr:uncharacterized protein LOC112803945 [Arachis hypogaea]